MTESTYRLVLLGILVLPVAGIIAWSLWFAPEPTPEPKPEPKPDLKPEQGFDPATAEYDIHGEFPALPEDSEAMQQLRQAMSGQMVRCAVCQSTVGHLYRVQLTDNAAFCCAPCATILEGSTQDGGTD
jgi:hypothetical protein